MPSEKNIIKVKELQDTFSKASAIYFTEYHGSEIFYIQFEIGDVEKTGKLRACNDAEGKTFCVREAQLGSSSDDNSYLQYMWLVLAAMLVSLLLYLTRRPGRRVSAPF